jgi:hypothetical protein
VCLRQTAWRIRHARWRIYRGFSVDHYVPITLPDPRPAVKPATVVEYNVYRHR